MRISHTLPASLLPASLLLLTACGGGGGGSSSTSTAPPPVANVRPVFSSAASASVAENVASPVLKAEASDADGDPITFSLGGADAAAFTIDEASGDLSFATPADFETPTDTDSDNRYALDIIADDGRGGRTAQAVTVTVTDLVPLPNFSVVGEGFAFPTYVDGLDGTDKLLVLEKAGVARLLDPETGTSTVFLDISSTLSSDSERGLLGFATPADFATDRRIYVHVSNLDGDTEIRRYDVTGEAADAASGEVVIRVAQPFANHNAGSIGFDANGYLVVPLGDGGSAGDPQNNAQNPQSLLGKVLRLDITRDAAPNDPLVNYAIPAGNTFTDPADGLPEIFAIGLRNPFRSSFDPATGDLLIADVGQDEREEISRLPMDDSSLNFGWRVIEGTRPFQGTSTATLTPPIAEYEHGDGPTQGNSVTGGIVVDGQSDALRNAYIFADFSSSNIWTIPATRTVAEGTISGEGFRRINDDLLLGSASPSGITGFGQDASGRVYVSGIGGTIWALDEIE